MAVAFVTSAEATRWPRLILLLPIAWWTLALGSGRSAWCFIDYVNLAFHEAGHVLLSFAGTTLHYLGGSIGQLVVPALLVHYFLREVRPYCAALCVWWVGESLVNIGVYMADARDLLLPLVGGGDHDWNELLFRFGILDESSVERISGMTRVTGLLLMLGGLAWSIYCVLPGTLRRRIWLESTLDA